MPRKISEEVVSKAVSLKLRGMTNMQIAEELGVSVDWCKRTLKTMTQNLDTDYDKVYLKSRRNEGISKGEIIEDLGLKELPDKERSKALQRNVRRIRANNKKNLVRPNWMHPNFAKMATTWVIESSMVLEERCNEQAVELLFNMKVSCSENQHHELPSVKQIKAAMLGLASASVEQRTGASAKLENWLQSLHRTSTELVNRNTQYDVTAEDKVLTDVLDFEDLADFMY
jgi:hypothetical protein